MRSVSQLLLGALLAVSVAWGTSRALASLHRMEYFRIHRVEVSGGDLLSSSDVLQVAGLPEGFSYWSDAMGWERAVETHPLIAEATIESRWPDRIMIEIVERVPVALVATPLLEPVDEFGIILPLDPAVRSLDLPLLRPPLSVALDGAPEPAALRLLAREARRVTEIDPRLTGSVSDLRLDAQGDVVMVLGPEELVFRFTAPVSPRRLREGIEVWDDAVLRRADLRPRVIDLRYEDQVVVRYGARDVPRSGRGVR